MLRLWNSATALLCPIHCEGHWSLLVLKKVQESAEKPVLQYFDSMESSTEHVQMKASPAEQILKFLLQDEQATLPPPSESQLQESNDCGFWVLAFCLEVLALLRNEGPRGRGQQQICVMDMKSLLATWLKILKTEQMKSQSDIENG